MCGSATVVESKPHIIQNTMGDSIFVPVPARFEAQRAILELQRFMNGLQSKMLQTPGYEKFQNAFSMMQKEPVIQNVVMSIVCDKAVWQAILDNKAVQDLKHTIFPDSAKEKKLLSSTEESEITMIILKWIMDFTKSKILELVEKFGQLVNEIFQPAQKEKPTSGFTDLLEESIRSSLLLSVVILLIVIVARNQV